MANSLLTTQVTTCRLLNLTEFIALAQHLARTKHADLFLTDNYGSKSIIGINPTKELILKGDEQRSEIADFCFADNSPTFGYLSYNYGQLLRGVKSNKQNELPYGHLKKYQTLLTYNHQKQKLTVTGNDSDIKNEFDGILSQKQQPIEYNLQFPENVKFKHSLNEQEYLEGVEQTLDYIREGYSYQLSLSIKLQAQLPDLNINDMLIYLWQKYPAQYYSLFESGDYKIISTSPEKFLHVQDRHVLSQPIKGTLRFDKYDDALVKQLQNSPKESAELSMIVDLVRNDISLNCKPGSVKVANHKSTFVIDNLIQMYSNVSGELEDNATALDLLLDAFPGGSVTGCPKRKSMELIDELEPHSREVYCGSMFILYDQDNMESSIAIRSGYYDNKCQTLNIFAGSGIVVESDPQAEYYETIAKAEKFINLLK